MLFKCINQVALLCSKKCQDMRQLFAQLEVCRRRSLFMSQLFVLVFRIRVSQQLFIFTVTVAMRANIQPKWLMYYSQITVREM